MTDIKNIHYDFEAKGAGTRQDLARALRLIANALDGGKEKDDKTQNRMEIDGASWNDNTLETSLRYAVTK